MVASRSLTNLVADADHVIIGRITLVDMVDEKGRAITNIEARTGPFLQNTIRFHVRIETNGILVTTAKHVPETIMISLWSAWHYSLGQIKELEGTESRIFLLKGPEFRFVYPDGFDRPLSERAEIERLLNRIRRTKQMHRTPR